MSRGKIMYQKVWTWKKRDYIILYYTEYADKDKDKEILNYNPLPSRGIIGVHFFKEKSNIIYQYISYTRFPS